MDYQTKKTHCLALSYEEVEEAVRRWLKAKNVFPPRDISHKRTPTDGGVCFEWESNVEEKE